MNKKNILIIVCLLVLAPILVKYLIIEPRNEEGKTYKVLSGQLPKVIIGTGTSVSLYEKLLTLNTSGRVEKLHAQPGDLVEADQLIMTLSSAQLEGDLLSANNSFSDKQLTINALKSELILTELESKLEINNLVSSVELEEFKYSRYNQLYKKNQLSAMDIKERELTLKRLQLSLDMKREFYKAKLASMAHQIELRLSQLSQAADHLEALKKIQRSLQVRAKHKGILSAINVVDGGFVNHGEVLASMYEITSIGAKVDISQELVHFLNIGDLASVVLNGNKTQAKITNIDANVANNHIAVHLAFVEPIVNLKVGQYLSAEFIIEDKRSKYLIHHEGRFYKGQSIDAILYKGTEMIKTQVAIGEVNETLAEIISPDMRNISEIRL